jgi:hypothetical protein
MNRAVPCNQRHNGVCGKECSICLPRSFASYNDGAKVAAWSTQNAAQPFEVALNSGDKYKFDCAICTHTFEITLYNVVKGRWCGFCGDKQLCTDDDCSMCFHKSLASYDPEKIYWFSSNNAHTPRQTFRTARQTVYFDCWRCGHEFDMSAANIAAGRWCGYCGNKQLCASDDCVMCHERSFASFDFLKVKCWDASRNNAEPRDVFKNNLKDKFWFNCSNCPHSFCCMTHSVTRGSWCPYCCKSNRKICGQPECTWCKKGCVVCLLVDIKTVGQRQTNDGLMCLDCYKRSPQCALTIRAKISMEIHTIHALQDECDKMHNGYKFRELTSWDCAVLPGTNFKPDLMWAFDAVGNCFKPLDHAR